MKEILENLELSEEVKTELTESFDAAVDAKVEAKTLEIVESKEAEYKEYVESQLEESRSSLEAKLEEYLDRVVEEFITENEAKLEEATAEKQYDAVLEGFNAVLVAAGVEIAQIAEAKEEADKELEEIEKEEAAELAESERVDALMEEVMGLKATNAELLKTGLVKESMEDMTDVQKEKFMKLATVVEFEAKAPEAFITKLDTIAESVVGAKAEVKETPEEIVESTKVEEKEEKVVEVANTPSWKKASHLY